MKEIKNKLQQKICAMFQRTIQFSLHIFSKLCVSLKRDNSTAEKDLCEKEKCGKLSRKEELKILRENDWYYQNSWFSSYFWDKLKRNIMNIVYKLFDTVEDLISEKYFIEIEFYTHKSKSLDTYNKKNKTNYLGDFKCYLPLVIQSREYDEAEYILGLITKELTMTYDCTIIGVPNLLKISSKELLQQKIDISINKLKDCEFGVLSMETFTPKLIQPNVISENDYFFRKNSYMFRALKNRPNLMWQNDEYFVQVKKMIPEQ